MPRSSVTISRESGIPVRERTAEQMAQLLGRAQPLAPWTLPCGTRMTTAWTRDGFHGYAAGMDGHLIAGYHRRARRCSWSVENHRLVGTLRPGAITLIPATHDGQWTLAGPLEVSHVYLSNERLQTCAASLSLPTPVELIDRLGFEDSGVARVLELLSQEALSQSAPTLFLDELLDLLCLQLVRRHSTQSRPPAAAATRGLSPRQLRVVAGYMRENLDRDIPLSELAGLLQLSRFYFCTAFRLATGKRPHEWLTLERMKRARTLLNEPVLGIVDISVLVGYRSPSAFSAAFRRVTGETPSSYRRRALG